MLIELVDRRDPAHLFPLRLPDRAGRDVLIAHLRAVGVNAVFQYVPLHTAPGVRRFARPGSPCPVTEDMAARLVRLPLDGALDGEGQGRVIDAVRSFGGAQS
jgi:dTDP-4-amino-4,6-dideoxygalactose transaminase